MAVWQFKVELIPSGWAQTHDMSQLFDKEGCDPSPAWKGYERIKPLCQSLGAILLKANAWHSDLSLWGNEEQSDIQLWREGNEIGSLSVRFDMQSPKPELFAAIAKVAEQFQLSILSVESMQYISPNQEALLAEASCSSAASFVKNPAGFLDGLRHNGSAT